MADKKPRYITPIGEAMYPWVHKPKAPFAGDSDKGMKFMIDVAFGDTDPVWKKWGSDFRVLAETLSYKGIKLPIKKELDENDQPTGRLTVTFKTGEKYPPGVFDKYGQKIPDTILIGNGSKVQVAYTMNYYEGFGGGINLYLSAVKVVDLVEYKGRSAEAYGFEVETAKAGTSSPASSSSPPAPEDDLPF